MTAPDERAPVLYAEPGSSYWPVLWGPAFAGLGAAVEAASGPVHVLAWVLVGVVLAGLAALWVRARRRVCAVRLTPVELTQGRETIEVANLAAVAGEDAPAGTRVLGGGWTVPRKFAEVPIVLTNGTKVLAWARDGDGLRAALSGLLTDRD